MERLTELDKRLLSALRSNGREPIASLAQMLGVSRATVTKRIDRLTALGVIVGFTVRVRDQSEVDQVRAISVLEVEGRTTDHVIRELRGFPEIQALHTTNGGWDLVVESSCPDLVAFDDMLRRIRGIDGIVNSESSLLLSSVIR